MKEMNLLNLEEISKAYVTRQLLDGVTVGINDGDKIGVVGINGTGKSTLLQIAAGELMPDEGQVIKGNSVRVSYLSQNPVFDAHKSVLENVAEKIRGKETHWDVTGEVRAKLQEFGIPDPHCSPSVLSGGQKKRAALIGAVLTPCDLMILDEPTNHLDYVMIEWLQNYLKSFRGALLMVTHDRYFLDEVTNQILELDRGKVYRYQENYSGYLELKQQRLDFALAAERKMAALYKKDLAWMQRGARARSTKQKAHIQRYEMLRDREKIVEERQAELNSLPTRLGGKTIILEGIGKSYGERCLFRDFDYRFGKTDRVGIVGANGCGKSTLLKCIIGQIRPDTGTVEIGQTVKISYFSQENEEMPMQMRVIDYVKETAEWIPTADGPVSASSMCERFLFDGEMQYSLIEKLSGGERRRLSLLKALMGAPNVLVLDEPTNDLDIQTLQVLEDYLDRFAGILLVVSHDRYFLDRVVTRVFSFQTDGTLYRSEGGFTDWEEHIRRDGRPGISGLSGQKKQNRGKKNGADRHDRQKKRLSYQEQKEYDGIEAEIDALEQKSRELEEQMQEAATQYTKLTELSMEKEAVDAKLEARMERFLELQEMVDALEKN